MVRAVLFDIDGTLIDSNTAHARAWVDALAELGIKVDFENVIGRIGMGSDHLLPSLLHIDGEGQLARSLSQRRGQIFRKNYLEELKPFPGTRELVEKLQAMDLRLVVATSSSKDDVCGLLEKAGVADILTEYTSADDAESSKPDPDIVQSALKKAGVPADQAVMIGDTPYDVEAATRAGVKIIAFTCGGWREEQLKGAAEIYAGPWELAANLGNSRFFRPSDV